MWFSCIWMLRRMVVSRRSLFLFLLCAAISKRLVVCAQEFAPLSAFSIKFLRIRCMDAEKRRQLLPHTFFHGYAALVCVRACVRLFEIVLALCSWRKVDLFTLNICEQFCVGWKLRNYRIIRIYCLEFNTIALERGFRMLRFKNIISNKLTANLNHCLCRLTFQQRRTNQPTFEVM